MKSGCVFYVMRLFDEMRKAMTLAPDGSSNIVHLFASHSIGKVSVPLVEVPLFSLVIHLSLTTGADEYLSSCSYLRSKIFARFHMDHSDFSYLLGLVFYFLYFLTVILFCLSLLISA